MRCGVVWGAQCTVCLRAVRVCSVVYGQCAACGVPLCALLLRTHTVLLSFFLRYDKLEDAEDAVALFMERREVRRTLEEEQFTAAHRCGGVV